jgi:small subunit ribosomal protein S1
MSDQTSEQNPSDSFKDLFEARAKSDVPRAHTVRVGDTVTGIVSHVGPSSVFVELDGKQQGYFDLVDVADAAGVSTLALGSEVKAVVVAVERESGQIKLARRFGKEAGVDHLRIAKEQAVPVEGKVVGVNKGGVAVEIGGVRCFCPVSQLDNKFVQDASIYLNQTLDFLVTEIRDKDVVLSRRALVEKASREAQVGLIAKLTVGSRHHGRVSQLREFGAFVEIAPGVEGLIPMRELSHDRAARAEDVVALNDAVEVEILESGIEPSKKGKGGDRIRLTLSLKRLASDPWDAVDALVPVGRVLAGVVVRTADFGAFVKLASGIDGLLPTSEVSSKARNAGDVLTVGQPVLVVARSVDKAKKRISLVLAEDGVAPGAAVEQRTIPVGAIVNAKVEKIETFGVFVQIEGTKGRSGRGLIPISELGAAHGVDLRKSYPEGTALVAKVIEGGDRMRLSVKRAHDDAERADFDSFKAANKSGAGMGTFGDLLKKKLGG